MIYNINNNKVYIGQTHNFRNRAVQHKSDLTRNTHRCKEMQKDFNEGMEFYFVILKDVGETCDNEELLLLEKQYMYCFYDKCMKLYNHETKEVIKAHLFYEMFYQTKETIQKEMQIQFGCPIPLLKHCSTRKLKEKFVECG